MNKKQFISLMREPCKSYMKENLVLASVIMSYYAITTEWLSIDNYKELKSTNDIEKMLNNDKALFESIIGISDVETAVKKLTESLDKNELLSRIIKNINDNHFNKFDKEMIDLLEAEAKESIINDNVIDVPTKKENIEKEIIEEVKEELKEDEVLETVKTLPAFVVGTKLHIKSGNLYGDAVSISYRQLHDITLFIYDGKEINGRYRVCLSKNLCLTKLSNIFGYIDRNISIY